MSGFGRQMQRASQRQEMDLLSHTMQSLASENERLEAEMKSLYRAMGAMVAVAGGEIRIPREMGELLAGKRLQSDVDGDFIVFTAVDATAAAVEEVTEEVATK